MTGAIRIVAGRDEAIRRTLTDPPNAGAGVGIGPGRSYR